MPASERILAALIGGALLIPAMALADYKAYARGQEAAEKQDWSAVESAMQEALAGNPNPKARVKLYGQRFAPYVPQYYLGLAAYRQNDCATALRWFGDGAAATVIAQLPEFKGVADAARSDCDRKLAATAPPKPPATTASSTTVPPATTSSTPPAATPPVTLPPKSPTTATPGPATTTVAAPVATSAPPPALDAALRGWLSGRYRSVVAGSVSGVQGKALAHLHLVRAASFHALSEIEAANAAAHRARAEQEIRSARSAQPAITVDAGFYSPRFRAYYASVR